MKTAYPLAARAERYLDAAAVPLQSVLLLLIRLWWGWSFFATGQGKLMNLERTTAFFAELGLPLPQLNALLAGSVEAAGGLCLMAGFAARFASVPLGFTMLVAYATADREALAAILSDPDRFTGAAPFLFLLTSALIFAFGPGRWSVDAWRQRRGANAGAEMPAPRRT
jgi:putative oxidoreductase